jgi:hypothetical protein
LIITAVTLAVARFESGTVGFPEHCLRAAITRLQGEFPNETIIADRRRSLCIRGDADAIRFRNAAR